MRPPGGAKSDAAMKTVGSMGMSAVLWSIDTDVYKRQAWESWKKTTPAERADALLKIADVIDQNKERLALLETLDNGKPIRETIDVYKRQDHRRRMDTGK